MANRKSKITNRLLQDICATIALYEPFGIDDVENAYLKLKSMDKLLFFLDMAKRNACSLERMIESGPSPEPTDVKVKEVKDVDKEFKKKWLRKGQVGIGIRKIFFGFGKD